MVSLASVIACRSIKVDKKSADAEDFWRFLKGQQKTRRMTSYIDPTKRTNNSSFIDSAPGSPDAIVEKTHKVSVEIFEWMNSAAANCKVTLKYHPL